MDSAELCKNANEMLFNHLDENMLVLALTELVRLVQRLDLDLPQIKQKIATITAITNIMPKIQKANASFDDDMHRMPSECKLRAFPAISSTEK